MPGPPCNNRLLHTANSQPQEKPFPVRSVPETLEKAADDSFAELSKQGLSDRDLMKATGQGYVPGVGFL